MSEKINQVKGLNSIYFQFERYFMICMIRIYFEQFKLSLNGLLWFASASRLIHIWEVFQMRTQRTFFKNLFLETSKAIINLTCESCSQGLSLRFDMENNTQFIKVIHFFSAAILATLIRNWHFTLYIMRAHRNKFFDALISIYRWDELLSCLHSQV